MKAVANPTGDTGDPPRQRRKPGRVPVSCAECRRLKLRCDRQVPCEKCVKRGCAAICPDGSLTTGNKMNRLAFADAEDLQNKIEQLRERCTSLEDALHTLQTNVSDQPHPLLQGKPAFETACSSPMPQAADNDLPNAAFSREDEEFLDAFGTLTLGMRGQSRYFGQTSRSEFLIHAEHTGSMPELSCVDTYPHISKRILEEALKGCETACDDITLKSEVLQMLPSLSQACRLCDLFLEQGEYLWSPLSRTQLFDEILSVIYRSAPHTNDQSCNLVSAHAASLLFMVFALSTLMDTNLPPYSLVAMEYLLLARLCLRFSAPMQDTTLWAIQSLIYQVIFLQLYDMPPSYKLSHTAWVSVGFAIKLGHSIGLHVKSSRWQLDEEASQRRAYVFWQLFFQDTWLSFGFGRPPCISLAFVDCEFPKDPEESEDAEGHRDWGYHPWSWQYTKLLHNVMTTAFGAKAPQYSVVLELDRRIRDFPTPWRLRANCHLPEDGDPGKVMHMQRWLVMSCKEITLLNLHRPYFAQVLSAMPNDPLKHRYGFSVIAIYRAAWRLIEGLIQTHKRVPSIIERLSMPWSQALSAAIVMCLMVTRAPTSSLASASLHELDRLCEIFSKLQDKSLTVAATLEAVKKMQTQAHEAINKIGLHDKSNSAFTELDRIGGKTHLLCNPSSSSSCVSDTASTSSGSGAASSSTTPSFYDSPAAFPDENVHPVLINDMRTFEGLSTSANDPSNRMAMDFNFDLSQAFPLPVDTQHPSDFQTLHDISGYFGADFFGGGGSSNSSAQPYNLGLSYEPPLVRTDGGVADMGGTPIPVPVLHETWQSFVEQLGF